MTRTARDVLKELQLARFDRGEIHIDDLDQAHKELEVIIQQEITKAKIDELQSLQRHIIDGKYAAVWTNTVDERIAELKQEMGSDD